MKCPSGAQAKICVSCFGARPGSHATFRPIEKVEYFIQQDTDSAALERSLDPKDNPQVVISGDEVTQFPKLKEFEPVAVKAERIKDVNGQITTSKWEVVDHS